MPFPYLTEKSHSVGPVTATSGNIASETGGAALFTLEGRQVLDVSDRIFMLKPAQSPFMSMLTGQGKAYDGANYSGVGLRKRSVLGPKFDCLTDQAPGRFCSVSGTIAASGAVTVTVTGAGSTPAKILTPGATVRNIRTREIMKVATVASDTTFTVAAAGRGFGTVAAAAGQDGDGLEIIGNSNAEFGNTVQSNVTEVGEEYNYTQIFRKALAISRTKSKTKLVGPEERNRLRAIKGSEMSEDIDASFLFGQRLKTTGENSKVERTTGGVEEHILASGAYVHDQGFNPLTAPDIEFFLSEGFSYGDNSKVLMSGSKIQSAVAEIARNQLQTKMSDQAYGLQISKWSSAAGFDISIVRHPKFNSQNGRDGFGFLLNLSGDSPSYGYAVLDDVTLHPEVQAPGVDGFADEYLAEVGLDRALAEQNAIIKNVV